MQPSLGTQELELIRFVSNSQAPLSAKEIVRLFGEPHGLARTTILTMLERLRKKGYLVRTQIEGIYHYESRVSKREFLRSIVRNFVETTLEGSFSPFVAYLTQEAETINDTDLDELKQLVDTLEQSREKRKDE